MDLSEILKSIKIDFLQVIIQYFSPSEQMKIMFINL